MRRIGAIIALAVLAGACAKDGGSFVEAGRPDDFEATPEYLASAIDDSMDLSYRFEGTMTFGMFGESSVEDVPVFSGAVDGERFQMRMDMGAMFESAFGALAEDAGEEMPDDLGPLLGGDLTMEMVVDDDAVYIRAPFVETFGDLVPEAEQDEALDVFRELGDDWGKVDLAALEGELPADVAEQLNSGQNMDPSAYLEIVAGAESVEDLGADAIDGVPVTGVAATVNFADMLEAQGQEPEDQLEEGLVELMEEFDFDVEVWIDGDSHVRRIVMDMGAGMEALSEEAGEEMPGDFAMCDFAMSMTFDFFDYGESVDIEIPDDEDVVDLTDEFVELSEDLGG